MADLSIERSISGLVAGCDEAGRGSWAGPLVAAAVILPKDVILPGVTDSKRINKKRHRELADKILEKALYVGIGVASSAFVDTHGVGYANRYALEQAVKNGARLDAWDEYFRHDVWMDAFRACGVDPDCYTGAIPEDAVLPWETVDVGIGRRFLLRERHLAYEGRTTPDCRQRCAGCGADGLNEGVACHA